MKKRLTTGMLAAATLLLAASAGSAQIRLVSSVIGAGGGTAAGPGRAMAGTVGQGIVGPTTAPALTAWQGFWYAAPPPAPAAVPSESDAMAGALRVTPNPIATEGLIQTELPRSGRASLILFDALGRQVMTLADGIQDGGPSR